MKHTNLQGAQLKKADGRDANLAAANLKEADLGQSNLVRAEMDHAIMSRASLSGANLWNARLSYANLRQVRCSGAFLVGVDFSHAGLVGTDFSQAVVYDADFSDAYFASTIFGDVDLSVARGLDVARHGSSSIIDRRTLARSSGRISTVFLERAGINAEFLPSLLPLFHGYHGKGEDSVYQRKDGRGTAVIPLNNGKKKFVYCKTQREALKELQLANHAKLQGALLTTGDQTVNMFLASWLRDTAQHRVREKTYLRYRELIGLHMLPIIGNVKLQKLAPQHIQRLYSQKREEGYAPQTIQHIHRLLHRALNDAVRWDLVVRNVCDAVDPPRVPKQEMQVLGPEQAQRLLEVAKEDPLETLYVLALTTGMREGELLALQWKDIDFVGGSLQVRRKVSRITGKGFVLSEPKTAKSRRKIPLAARSLEVLKQHRVRQHEQRLALGESWEDQGWIFTNALGKNLEVSNMIRRSFRPLLVKAGLPQIRFHDLRHSCATLLLSMGIHPKVVQERLGHSQISVTLDTYSHVLPSMQEDAAQRLDALLS